MSDKEHLEILSIDSPIHRIKAVEEAIKDTGAAMLFPTGVEEFAEEFQNKSKEEILEMLESMRMLPDLIMGERPSDVQPVIALFTFIDQGIANMLDPVEKDARDTVEDE